MQAIELETTISPQGGIALPPEWQRIYGRHARMILLLDDAAPAPATDPADRRTTLRQALSAVAQAGTFAGVADVSDWQREVRAERSLPGREG
jgi:hypothetical protein